jgi:hypothetical protein
LNVLFPLPVEKGLNVSKQSKNFEKYGERGWDIK